MIDIGKRELLRSRTKQAMDKWHMPKVEVMSGALKLFVELAQPIIDAAKTEMLLNDTSNAGNN